MNTYADYDELYQTYLDAHAAYEKDWAYPDNLLPPVVAAITALAEHCAAHELPHVAGIYRELAARYAEPEKVAA